MSRALRRLCWGLTLVPILTLFMVDIVHTAGDHTSYLVLAPYPTLAFTHSGGEEGAWEHAHPGEQEPWWLRGDYLVIREITGK